MSTDRETFKLAFDEGEGVKRQIASYKNRLQVRFEVSSTRPDASFDLCKMDSSVDKEFSFRVEIRSE